MHDFREHVNYTNNVSKAFLSASSGNDAVIVMSLALLLVSLLGNSIWLLGSSFVPYARKHESFQEDYDVIVLIFIFLKEAVSFPAHASITELPAMVSLKLSA